jgi:hypothetical protein
MTRETCSRLALGLAVLLMMSTLGAATVTRQQADVFVRKLNEIAKPNPKAIRPGLRRTPVTEGELNSWFAFHAQPLLPAGVSDPQITIVGDGKVAGQAVVDFDAISKKRASGATLDPWRLIGGRVPVNVLGTLQTRNGIGRFDLESADVAGVPVPKALLQEMISMYSRSEKSPQGLRLDDPFPLPANIQQIEVGQGRAVVVQ